VRLAAQRACSGAAGGRAARTRAGDAADLSWVRRARDVEALPGRGLRAWVPSEPGDWAAGGGPGGGPPPPAGEPGDWAAAAAAAEGSPAPAPARGGEVRVLVGNRALMAAEDVALSRRAAPGLLA